MSKNTCDIGLLHELFNYDPLTGAITNRLKRAANAMPGKPAGGYNNGYLIIRIGDRPFKGHRVAWALHYGEWPATGIDHINGNSADNRIANLRLATQAQNVRNMRRDPGPSGFRGVDVHGRRFRAAIHQNGTRRIIGSYETPEEAHAAYVAASIQIHGEFAYVASRGMEK